MKRTIGSTVHRFTVGIPEPLYEQGEKARLALGMNRSEYVAMLYRAYLKEVALQEKIDRYREAYARLPPTEEEDDWVRMSEAVFAAGED